MINALWNATIGYTLRFFWNPLDSSQTLIEDSAIDQLRAFAVRYLRPGGPLSALRVGNTPYGILPITARGFVPKANSRARARTARGDRLVPRSLGRGDTERADAARPERREPAPGAGDAAVGADQALLAGRRARQRSRTTRTSNPLPAGRALFIHFLVASLLDKLPFTVKAPFLAECAVRPKATSLDAVPWVQRDPAQPKRELDGDEPLARNFIAALLDVLSTPTAQVRGQLVAMQNGESLLEAMLAFAADEEVLHSGRALFRDHLTARPNLSATIKAQAKRMRPAEYVGVDVVTQVGDQFDVGHANAVLGAQARRHHG